jgi:transcriptional regulator with XRE-family HTH domain
MPEENYLKNIGANITRIRKQKGMSYNQLGVECDIEKSNLIPIEKGRINVTVLTLLRIANALKTDVKTFFEDK